MKLPLLQKIEIENADVSELDTIFKKNAVGKTPTILIFKNLTLSGTREALEAASLVCKSSRIDPHFPYPIYFLDELNIEQSFFPVLKDINDAPRHFIKKIKRIKKREQVLLDKVTTLSERIQNHPVKEDLEYLAIKAVKNKKLKELCVEKAFYLELLTNLKSPHREDKEV